MDSRPQIRAASQADAAQIAEIYAHHVAHGTASFDTVPRSVDDTIAKIEDCHARGWPFLVATDGTTVLGYAYAGPFRLRAAYRYTVEDSVYVGPDAVGQGVGRALLGVHKITGTRSVSSANSHVSYICRITYRPSQRPK